MSSSDALIWNLADIQINDNGSEISADTNSLVPRLFGEGGKRAWYLLFVHALNYLAFQSFWISPGTSVLC